MGGEARTEAAPPLDPREAQEQFVALPGVGEKLAARLVAAGFHSLAMLAEAKIEALQEIEGIGPKSGERILQVAREAVGAVAAAPSEEASVAVPDELAAHDAALPASEPA
jgi:ERCC4-type nuclease